MEEVGMKVLVVYYSMYGHVLELAQAAVDGIKEVAGVEAVLRRVQEFAEIEKEIDRHEHARAPGQGARRHGDNHGVVPRQDEVVR
jgi:multimeric flavodoxin WrbA